MKFWDWFLRVAGFRNDFVTVAQVAQAASGSSKVGDGLDSNVVMAPVQWIMRTFTQAEPVVQKYRSGRWHYSEDHPVELLLAQPNPHYDGDALTKATLLSFFLDGNGYWITVRDALRRPVEYWYAPHWLIEPVWPTTPGNRVFISHYDYRPDGVGGAAVRVPVSDVVHVRFGIDPRNTRKGLSPLKAVMREVVTDEEASAFSAYILSNMGVPGGVIAPKSADARPSKEDVKEMKEYMKSSFTGAKRGEWFVTGIPTDVAQFGFDPNRLMLGPLRDISEERVCSMLGIPAAVVGFGAGLQQTKVGATMRELVRLARVNCVEPTQVSIARQLSRQILPEFETKPAKCRIMFDNENVSMFQEDETERARRAEMLYTAKLATREEGRAMVGLPETPEGEFAPDAPPKPAPGGGGGTPPEPAARNRITQGDPTHTNGDRP